MKKEKICEFCGEPFVPRSNFQRYCKRPHYMNCPVCGKKYLVTNNENLKRPPVACSYECRVKRTQETSMKKYGVKAPGNNPEARKKAKKTMQERFGVDYAMQSDYLKNKAEESLIKLYGVNNAMKSPQIRDKAEATNIERYGSKSFLSSEKGKEEYKRIMLNKYGVEYPLQNEDIKHKYNSTCREKYNSDWFIQSEEGRNIVRQNNLKKYGCEFVTQVESVKSKMKKTFYDHYGVDNPSKNPEIVKKIRDTMRSKYGVEGVLSVPEIRDKIMKTNMARYGVPFYVMLDEVRKSSGAISKLNTSFANKLKEKGVEFTQEYRIGRMSFDFFIPESNTLVDLNPTYTHNLIGNHWDPKGKPIGYHIQRCKKAHENGYNIICSFDWDSYQDLIEQFSAPVQQVSEHDLTYYKLNRSVGVEFLKKYGWNRRVQYPRKTLFFGCANNSGLLQAVAIGLDNTSRAATYSILDIGSKWGLKTRYAGYKNIFKLVSQFIDLSDLSLVVDSDRVIIEDLNNLGIIVQDVNYRYPQIYWSKNRTRIPYNIRRSSLASLEDGWLPIEDCGKIIIDNLCNLVYAH